MACYPGDKGHRSNVVTGERQKVSPKQRQFGLAPKILLGRSNSPKGIANQTRQHLGHLHGHSIAKLAATFRPGIGEMPAIGERLQTGEFAHGEIDHPFQRDLLPRLERVRGNARFLALLLGERAMGLEPTTACLGSRYSTN